jgi:hypothetical protein
MSDEKTNGNFAKPIFSVVFIDEFGHLVDEINSQYKVVLDGSYSWCFVGKCWRHEIKCIFPKIPLSYILSDVILVK